MFLFLNIATLRVHYPSLQKWVFPKPIHQFCNRIHYDNIITHSFLNIHLSVLKNRSFHIHYDKSSWAIRLIIRVMFLENTMRLHSTAFLHYRYNFEVYVAIFVVRSNALFFDVFIMIGLGDRHKN